MLLTKSLPKTLSRSIYYLWIEVISTWFTLLILLRWKSFSDKPRHIFINYAAYGHSISETRAFFSTENNQKLCISIGEIHERNPNIEWLFPTHRLYHLLIPSILKKHIEGFHFLRKYVGKRVKRNMLFLFGFRLRSGTLSISSDHVAIANVAAIHNMQTIFKLDRTQASFIFEEYCKRSEVQRTQESVGIGTTIMTMLMDKLPEFQIQIPTTVRHAFLKEISYINFANATKNAETGIICLIIGDRGKLWHGPGISYYSGVLEWLCKNTNDLIIVLGDDNAVNSLKTQDKGFVHRLFTTKDFLLPSKQVEILALYYSRLTMGDRSGVWALFSLIGSKGFVCNSIPTGDLFNRCFVTPRRWVTDGASTEESYIPFYEVDRRIRFFNNSKGENIRPISVESSRIIDLLKYLFKIELSLENVPYKPQDTLLDLVQKHNFSKFLNC